MSTATPKGVVAIKSGHSCKHRRGNCSPLTELILSNRNDQLQDSTSGIDFLCSLGSSEGQHNEQLILEILNVRNNINKLRELILQEGQNSSNRGSPPSRDLSRLEIIRPRDLPLVTGLSRTSCWRLSKDPKSGFPPKIRLSVGAVGYSKKAIEEWLKSREELQIR
jgi:predicted DNA-binding transcriptional regulator AlpA